MVRVASVRFAFFVYELYAGMAMAAKMAMIPTVTTSSMSVNPFLRMAASSGRGLSGLGMSGNGDDLRARVARGTREHQVHFIPDGELERGFLRRALGPDVVAAVLHLDLAARGSGGHLAAHHRAAGDPRAPADGGAQEQGQRNGAGRKIEFRRFERFH